MSTEPKWVIVAIEGSKRWYFDSAETHAEAREKQVKWNHRAATDPGWSEMAFVLEKYWEPEMTDDMADGPNPKPEMDGREITDDAESPARLRERVREMERCLLVRDAKIKHDQEVVLRLEREHDETRRERDEAVTLLGTRECVIGNFYDTIHGMSETRRQLQAKLDEADRAREGWKEKCKYERSRGDEYERIASGNERWARNAEHERDAARQAMVQQAEIAGTLGMLLERVKAATGAEDFTVAVARVELMEEKLGIANAALGTTPADTVEHFAEALEAVRSGP